MQSSSSSEQSLLSRSLNTFNLFRSPELEKETLIENKTTKKIGKVSKYLFSQQLNDSCHISPIRNYQILQNLKQQGLENSLQDESNWHDRRTWFGKNQYMIRSWFEMFEKMNDPSFQAQYPDLYQFMLTGIEQGPTIPNMYDQEGTNLIQSMNDLMKVPYFLIDLKEMEKKSIRVFGRTIQFNSIMDLSVIGIKIGIIKDKQDHLYKIFNHETSQYEVITPESHPWLQIEEQGDLMKGEMGVKVTFLPDCQEESLQHRYTMFPNQREIWMSKNASLGFEEIAVARDLGSGLSHEGKKYAPYEMSLCKLMLMNLLLDEENEEGVSNPVLRDFKRFTDTHHQESDQLRQENDMWHESKFNRHIMLQYQIAERLKMMPELKEILVKILDSMDFDIKQGYDEFTDGKKVFYRDTEQKTPMMTKEYLLGDDQALAYFLCNHLRYTWYASMNPKAYQASLGVNDLLGSFSNAYPASLKQKQMKRQTLKKRKIEIDGQQIRISLLDVWNELRASLGNRDFVSFDDHGWLMSLDPEVIEQQNRRKDQIYDPEFVRQLGFAGIESWLSNHINPWYKKDVMV